MNYAGLCLDFKDVETKKQLEVLKLLDKYNIKYTITEDNSIPTINIDVYDLIKSKLGILDTIGDLIGNCSHDVYYFRIFEFKFKIDECRYKNNGASKFISLKRNCLCLSINHTEYPIKSFTPDAFSIIDFDIYDFKDMFWDLIVGIFRDNEQLEKYLSELFLKQNEINY